VEDGRVPGKDGLAAPDELVTVEIDVTNVGDQPGKAKVQLSAGDALVFPPEPKETGTIAPGQMTTLKLPGRITRNASCGEELALDIRAPGGKGPSRAVTPVVVGLKAGPMESFDGPGLPAGWQVNADGKDTGTKGRWEAGTPQRSLFYDYTLQPGAAFSGSGAAVTGLSADEIDNVEGRTSLTSAAYAIKGLADPRLSYQVYFVSADFDALAGKEVLVPSPAGSLAVEASLDGTTWTEVDRVTGMANGWQRRLVSLAPVLGAGGADSVRFRFVVEETGMIPVVVEAVLDDVGVFSAAPSCAGAGPGVEPDAKYVAPAVDGSGGCSFGGGGSAAASGALLAALGLLLMMRRRRQHRAPAR
jgi:MYXO-CTERM domain-containing protein